MEYKLTINGEEQAGIMSAYTFLIYEQEFEGADLISDVNGKLRASDFTPDEDLVFDFSSIAWGKILQGVWAMLKTADESVPHYAKWARGVTEVNTLELRGTLQEAMGEAFFHTSAAGVERDG